MKVLGWVLLSVPVWADVTADSEGQVYWPLKKGQIFRYTGTLGVGDWTVKTVERDGVATIATLLTRQYPFPMETEIKIRSDRAGICIVQYTFMPARSPIDMERGFVIVPGQLRPGRRWRDEQKANYAGTSLTLTAAGEVIGTETVAVASGSYHTWRIQVQLAFRNPGGGGAGGVTWDFWFARGIGIVRIDRSGGGSPSRCELERVD